MDGAPIEERARHRRRGRLPGRRRPAPASLDRGVAGGGRYRPLSEDDCRAVHATTLELLSTLGLSQPIPSMVEHVVAKGGRLTPDGRLLFPKALVEDVIAGARRDIVLHGRRPGLEIEPVGDRVYVGSGGAAPSIVDLETGRYRPATARDLYDAARLVDTLDNIHLFSRSLVARDARDPHQLDVNTAYACLAGTAKHVCVSASDPNNVRAIAEVCATVAGDWARFVEAPFLTIMVCHVVPPMRFAEVIAEVSRGEGHYLGHPQTLARMERDYVYPSVADRRTPTAWEESGGEGMRARARRRAREVLAEHFPRHIDDACDAMLRDVHDILIPRESMRAGEAG